MKPSSEPLRSLLYISTACRPMTRSDLDNLLHVSRANNAKNELTGVLSYCSEQFIQVLEGPQSKVEKTLHEIIGDDRHTHLTVMYDEIVDERSFDNWAMARFDLDEDDLKRTGVIDRVIPKRGTANHQVVSSLFSIFQLGLA